MVDIQSATAEIRWRKKEEEERRNRTKISCPLLLRRAAITVRSVKKLRRFRLSHCALYLLVDVWWLVSWLRCQVEGRSSVVGDRSRQVPVSGLTDVHSDREPRRGGGPRCLRVPRQKQSLHAVVQGQTHHHRFAFAPRRPRLYWLSRV